MGEKKGLSQTPLWALSEEEMAAAGWTGTQGEDLNGQPAERSSVLQEGFGVLPSVLVTWVPEGVVELCCENDLAGRRNQRGGFGRAYSAACFPNDTFGHNRSSDCFPIGFSVQNAQLMAGSNCVIISR